MNHKFSLTCLLIMFYLPPSVLAETETTVDHRHVLPLPVSADLNLHDVVEATYQRNPRLQVIEARLRHISSLERQSESLWVEDPAFSLGHYNDLIMDNDGLQEWEVGLEMPLWLPGQKAAQKRTIERQRRAIDSSVPALKLQLASIVREILWDIALRKNQLVVARQEWEVTRKLEQDVEKRVSLGDLAQSDLILAQQESLAKEAAFQRAKQEYHHSQHRYDMITGLDVLPAVFEEVMSPDLTIDTDHPGLKVLKDVVDSSHALRDQTRIERRGNPTLFVGTRHERGNSEEGFANAIGMRINIPLGLASQTMPKITAAEIAVAENQSAFELRHRQLNIEIQDVYRELMATKEQYEFAQRQRDLTSQNLSMSQKAFALGESSLIDLIRIQALAFAAERNMHQKKLEVGRLTARLNQARGIIP